MESTFMTAMERGTRGRAHRVRRGRRLVREHRLTRNSAWLDRGRKRQHERRQDHAAMDIAVALSELMRRNSRDKMKLFLFLTRCVKCPTGRDERQFCRRDNGYKERVKAVQTSVAHETADKQVYLIQIPSELRGWQVCRLREGFPRRDQ